MAFRGIVSNRPDNVSVEPTPSRSLSRSVSVIPGRRGDCHLDRDPLAVAGGLAPAPGASGDRSPRDRPSGLVASRSLRTGSARASLRRAGRDQAPSPTPQPVLLPLPWWTIVMNTPPLV